MKLLGKDGGGREYQRYEESISPETDTNVKEGQAYCFGYIKQRCTTEIQTAQAHQTTFKIKAGLEGKAAMNMNC